MGLIYVNPEGPNGNPDPLAAARDIRETFRRMAMNDEETLALIAGGHTFGKTHGAAGAELRRPGARGRPDRGAGPGLEEQLRQRQGQGRHHQRPGGHLDLDADPVEQRLLREPVPLRVGADREPRRRQAVAAQGRRRRQHRARTRETGELEPAADDAHHRPRAAGRPAYEKIARRFLEHPDEFADAFAKAWYKLLHRDMGPVSRYLGPWVAEPQLWQDPVPAVEGDAGRRGRHRGAEGASCSTRA